MQILEELCRPLKGTFAWNKDSYNFWQIVREYNNSLPADRRIQVIGVDIEHQVDTAYRYLLDVWPEMEPAEAIKRELGGLRLALDGFDHDAFMQKARELLDHMEEHESTYREYFGEDYIGFKLVNKNILNAAAARPKRANFIHWNNTRDEMIYENFLLLEDELVPGKYYGQWGSNHAYQSTESNIKWFAAYLNSEASPFADKVLSIAFLYDNCMTMARGDYKAEHLHTLPEPLKKANDLIGGNLNMYRLAGAPDPISTPQLYYITAAGKPVTDFYQYVVCIKESQATEPLNLEY